MIERTFRQEDLKTAIVIQIIYSRHLKIRVGGKRVKALNIDGLCDWPEREQATPTQLQRRRVYSQ